MIIRASTLKAVLPAATDQDRRFTAMACLEIAPDGTVTATNGHVLLQAREQAMFKDEDFPSKDLPEPADPPTDPILLPATAAEKLIAGTAKKATIPILQAIQIGQTAAGEPYAAATDLQIPTVVKLGHVKEEVGDFPRYRHALSLCPEDRPVIEVTLGVAVLETLIKAAKALRPGTKRSPRITLAIPIEPKYCERTNEPQFGTDDTETPTYNNRLCSAIRIQIGGDEAEMTGLIMPFREER